MVAKKRDQVLSDVLERLDIPQWVYTTPASIEQGIGPYSPDAFIRHEALRREGERTALAELEAMGDLELVDMADDDVAFKHFTWRHHLPEVPPWYAGGFGARPLRDFNYWSRLASWTIHETTCLSIGIAPCEIPKPRPLAPPQEQVNFFWSRYEMVRRALADLGEDANSIRPKRFAKWAMVNGVEAPDALLACLSETNSTKNADMLKDVDARKFHTSQKIILALINASVGYRGGKITNDAKDELLRGLSNLGLRLDPKTIRTTFAEIEHALGGYQAEQVRRDNQED